jgi:hypothetical protein
MRIEVLHSVREKKDILHTVKRRMAKWIGHILRSNCPLKHIIEGKMEGGIEVKGRRRRRCESLLYDLNKKIVHWKTKEEALNTTIWRTSFRRGYGYDVIRATEGMFVLFSEIYLDTSLIKFGR